MHNRRGIKRIFQMAHLQPHSLHPVKKSERSVNHLDERIFEQCSSLVIFFESCMASVGFFPFDYDTKSEKEDENKKKYISWVKLQMIEL